MRIDPRLRSSHYCVQQ